MCMGRVGRRRGEGALWVVAMEGWGVGWDGKGGGREGWREGALVLVDAGAEAEAEPDILRCLCRL